MTLRANVKKFTRLVLCEFPGTRSAVARLTPQRKPSPFSQVIKEQVDSTSSPKTAGPRFRASQGSGHGQQKKKKRKEKAGHPSFLPFPAFLLTTASDETEHNALVPRTRPRTCNTRNMNAVYPCNNFRCRSCRCASLRREKKKKKAQRRKKRGSGHFLHRPTSSRARLIGGPDFRARVLDRQRASFFFPFHEKGPS